MPRKTNENTVRVGWNCPEKFVGLLDSDAMELGLSRSNMITLIVNQYYEGKKAMSKVGDMKSVIDKAVVVGENPDFYGLNPKYKNDLEEVLKDK